MQELHGSPWNKNHTFDAHPPSLCRPSSSASTPILSPSSSEASLPVSAPNTPPHQFATLHPHVSFHEGEVEGDISRPLHSHLLTAAIHGRPEMHRRPSHDLFECIEQSEHKKLNEDQARYVFSQVVDAIDYLHRRGIVHRDIKDENLVIDVNLKVRFLYVILARYPSHFCLTRSSSLILVALLLSTPMNLNLITKCSTGPLHMLHPKFSSRKSIKRHPPRYGL